VSRTFDQPGIDVFTRDEFERAWQRDADSPRFTRVQPETAVLLRRNSPHDFQDRQVYVFVDGEAWGKNHQQRPLAEACKRAKISPSLRFHEARHSYASALAQAGADLLTISKLLGHADTRITSRHYAHLCDRTLANAVNNLLPSFGETEPTNVAAIR